MMTSCGREQRRGELTTQPLAVSTARLVEQQADLACDYRGINPDELSTRLVVRPFPFPDTCTSLEKILLPLIVGD